MSITKQETGRYFLNIRPEGVRGRRVRKLFKTKHAALNYQKEILSNGFEKKQCIDDRTFNDLVELWYNSHGVSLKTSVDTRNRLLAMSLYFPKKSACNLQVNDFVNYRTMRLDQGIKPSTLNRELATLNSLFNELYRMGHVEYSNPFALLRRLKQKKTELSYLTYEQFLKLFTHVSTSLNPSLHYVVKICISTGARWSEAESIMLRNIKNGGLEFLDTKNGSNRFVPITKDFELELVSYLKHNEKFDSCYAAFRSALKRSGIKTPEGQCAHILRHTYASHFIMNGGNILALQKILGHSSLQVTTRYSHLAPDFLNQAIQFNLFEFNNHKPG